MIVFAHTKFGLVRIQGSEVKGGRNPPPRSERVFQIPVQIGLSGFRVAANIMVVWGKNPSPTPSRQ